MTRAPHQGITAAAATTHQAFSHSALALTSVSESSALRQGKEQPTPSTLTCVRGPFGAFGFGALQSALLMPWHQHGISCCD